MATKLKNMFDSAMTTIHRKLRRSSSLDTAKLIFDSQAAVTKAKSALALLDQRDQLMRDAFVVLIELGEVAQRAKKLNVYGLFRKHNA